MSLSKPARRVLLAAVELLKKGWTTGELARDASGKACGPRSKKAVCWCAEGAVRAAARGNEETYYAVWSAFYDGAGIDAYDDIIKWHDGQKSVEPVIEALMNGLKVKA